MLVLIPTKKQIKLAREKDKLMREECLAKYGTPYPPNSIEEGAGNLPSFVAEAALCDLYGLSFVPPEERHDYDVYRDDYFGRVENKTKVRTVPPKPYYFGAVAATNTRQRCDFYCFTSILKDLSKLWLCGFCRKDIFFEKDQAQFFYKGDPDPTSDRGWRFKADCWNLPYGDMLTPPEPDHIGPEFEVGLLV